MITFECPAAVAGREQITTELRWSNGAAYHTGAPLTDANVWLLGFTVGDVPPSGQIASAEYQGPATMRDYALIRNSDGAIIEQSGVHHLMPQIGPGIQFVQQQHGRLDRRLVFATGERYTFAIWNHTPGQSSPMVAELYV